MAIGDGICLTATLDILRAIASGSGPEKAVLALGYAGWSSGQLESEIRPTAGSTAPPIRRCCSATISPASLDHALGLLGARAAHLSSEAGHA